MPTIKSDSVDIYPFRRVNGRAQFLVLLRRPGLPLGNTWHGVHAKVGERETAYDAAVRELLQTTGMQPTHLYSADLISQFYDHYSDAIALTPVFAALLEGPGPVIRSPDYSDFAWCDLDEAVARLLSSAQRWAVRHIADIIAEGGPEAEFYRIE
jgi:dihydroneopterin triphosphate diphosphatase